MGFIFNKSHNDYSVYETDLKKAEASTNKELRAIAVNLRFDHRVPSDREKKFRKFYEDAVKSKKKNSFKVALDEYRRQKIIEAVIPDFCCKSYRHLIAECSSSTGYCCKPFDKNQYLVTVMSLNGLKRVITGANDADKYKIPGWVKFSNDLGIDENEINDSMFGGWLNNQLNGKDPDSPEVENFILSIFDVLNSNLKKKRYNIYWVSLWDDFKKYATTANIDRWNQVVGVPRVEKQWQIILKYPAMAVDSLYRPTQLDGGYYPQHFPPPKSSRKATGGHTMDLAPTDNVLLPEYIHRQIELKPEYWVKGLIGRTQVISGSKSIIRFLRKRHYRKLESKYDPKKTGLVKKWMPKSF